ncbi:melanocyte protein PMEL [Notechis scutatus]|uniref:Melanocyte protein PMEL n=1 Tax=Notechis scutatus TaxID=8663 RepID=A0A6J1UU33_9SAUR|nr:melanocyte protein PMEL [Notechis scutatus]
MSRIWFLWAAVWALLATTSAQRRFSGRNNRWGQNGSRRYSAYKTWNSSLYPRWREGDPRQGNCWRGGNVTFDIGNDAPTLTSAKVTFRITLRFPSNQTALPDGRVVWSQNCIINGTRMRKGDPVFPDQEEDASDYVFPDGQPFSPSNRRPGKFVFVWQTWVPASATSVLSTVPPTVTEEATSVATVPVANISAGPGETDLAAASVEPTVVASSDATEDSEGVTVAMSASLPNTMASTATSESLPGSVAAGSSSTIAPENDPGTPEPTVLSPVASTIVLSVDNSEDTAAINLVSSVMPATGTVAGDVVQLLVKRQAPSGCLLYRYGTFATDLDIIQGIESVEIVQVMPLTPAIAENAVDLTVTCQGSLPEEVCTTISDPDCVIVQESVCNPVQPSPDCQFVLRQAFNQSGLYCVNISLADANTLAVASTQVSVQTERNQASAQITFVVGALLVIAAMGAAIYTYRHLRHIPLRAMMSAGTSPRNWFPDRTAVRLFLGQAFGRRASGESSPLLSGNVI